MRTPKLCHHKGRELGYVTIRGKEEYFTGRWPRDQDKAPQAVERQYLARLKRWAAERAAAPGASEVRDDPSLDELWLAFFGHVKIRYVKHGKPTAEVNNFRRACSVAARLYGEEPAAEFSPKRLKAVRAEFVAAGWCRASVNRAVDRVRAMFRWGVEHELVPETVYRALCAVAALPRGAGAPESKGVKAVDWSRVEAVLPHLRPALRDLVRVHRLIGCRAQDVAIMRPSDIDRGADPEGGLWLWTPTHHVTNEPTSKTEHHKGEPLRYWVGPQCQEVLKPLLETTAPDGWLFPTRTGTAYTTHGYRRCVENVCATLGVPAWTPLQVRHARLTEIRRQNWEGRSGAEAAQAVARHKHLSTTEVYAERDESLAREVMRRLG